METYKVMYWKYTKDEMKQIWIEFDDPKKAIKKLNKIGNKGEYCELWYKGRIIDYRN